MKDITPRLNVKGVEATKQAIDDETFHALPFHRIQAPARTVMLDDSNQIA
jgi:hypothetical protein